MFFCFVLMQAGKHEAIVKNVHDLLAKLAWDFSPEQLDHLFDCFKVRVVISHRWSFFLLWVKSVCSHSSTLNSLVSFLSYRQAGPTPAKSNVKNYLNLFGAWLKMTRMVWWPTRCWTCCGTWHTVMMFLWTLWTKPLVLTSRYWTIVAHRCVL